MITEVQLFSPSHPPRKYGSFEAQGIFEPPKYFPFGTTYNWQVRFSGNIKLDVLILKKMCDVTKRTKK